MSEQKEESKYRYKKSGIKRRRLSDNLLLDLCEKHAENLFDYLIKLALASKEERAEMGYDSKDQIYALEKVITKIVIVGKYKDYLDQGERQHLISFTKLIVEVMEKFKGKYSDEFLLEFIELLKSIKEREENDSLDDEQDEVAEEE